MTRQLSFDASRAPAVLAALQHGRAQPTTRDLPLLRDAASAPLDAMWERAAVEGAQWPRAAVETLLLRALDEAEPGGPPPGADLFDPARISSLFADVLETAQARAALPPALSEAERALVPAEVARAERDATIPLLHRLTYLNVADISDVPGRGILTVVDVLKRRAAQGDADAGYFRGNLCWALISRDTEAPTSLGEAMVRELLDTADAYLHGVAIVDSELQYAACCAHAILHPPAPIGTEVPRAERPSVVLANVPSEARDAAERAGARVLLQKLVEVPVSRYVAEAAHYAAGALAGERLPRDWPRYDKHLTAPELNAALTTAYQNALGDPQMTNVISGLRPDPLPVDVLANKRLEFLEAGNALALYTMAKQVLPPATSPQSAWEIDEALDRVAPIGRQDYHSDHDGYPARQEAWLATMIARVHTETFSAPNSSINDELLALVNWVRGSERIFASDARSADHDPLSESFTAALTAARTRAPDDSATAKFLDDRLRGAP